MEKIRHAGPDQGEFTITGDVPPRRCENCAAWGRAEGGITVCRSKPGVALPLMNQTGIAGLVTLWVPMKAHDWCRQWEPAGALPTAVKN